MRLDLHRARTDARRAARESGVPLGIRRALHAEIQRCGTIPWDRLTIDGEKAIRYGTVLYTGGMGPLGVGTTREQFPVKRAMEAEFRRVFWTEAP